MRPIVLISPLRLHCLLALAATLMALNAAAAWHDDFPGSGTSVHYVRLKGYGGDNDLNRKNLAASYEACVATLSAFGKKPAPLPPKGLPAIISEQQIEIYYAANQTLTVKQGALQVVDQDTCAITGVPHRLLEVSSAAGRCDIDLIKNETRGICSTHAQQSVPDGTESRPTRRLAVDRNKVPPEMRAQLDAQLAQLAKLSQSRPDRGVVEALSSTGQLKNVAGTPCEVRRSPSLPYELCIANLVSTPERPLDPYPIAVAPLNAGVPGLLLEAKTPALTLQAEEVRFNLLVAHQLFTVPADVKSKSATGRRP